jgi:hypothetical protein
MRLAAVLVPLFALLSISASPQAIAQQPSPASGATVHGMVTDPDDALVPGATVTLTPATGKPQIVKSGSDGTYAARGLPAGTYVMTVTAPGFGVFVKEGIKVAANTNLAIDSKLVIAEESQQMTVTTNSAQLSVDPDSNASATVITGAALDALSDDPDELQTELTALAGPSMGPNGGQIYIDGFTGGQLPPKASIMAIRINQNPFSAQYDQLGFGRIEILTRPGADKFHGSAGLQFGDKVLNTSTPFLGTANSQPNYYTIFSTGNLTGPIRQGMSFNVSGSYRDIKNNNLINPSGFYASSATSTTLCAPGNLSCSSQAFPTTARALSNPQTRWDISPRVDVALGQKNTLTTRVSYTHQSSSLVPSVASQLLTTGSNSNSSDVTLQVSDTQLLGSRIVNESRFEYEHTASSSTPLSTSPFINVQGILSAGGSSAGTTSVPGDHIEAQNYTSVQLAKNFIRFGGRLRSSGESAYSNGGTNGSFTYSYLLDPCVDPTVTNKPSNCVAGLPSTAAPCAATNYTGGTAAQPSSYQCGVVSQFSLTNIVNSTIQARETDVGFYAEDDWKALSNLTISYGLRLEAQNVINSTRDFGPRTSIAYGIPTKSGKTTTVVRAGFGIFYNRFQLNSIASQITNNGKNTQDLTYSSPGSACQPLFNGTAFTGYSPSCTTASATAARTTIQLNDAGLRSPYIMQSALTVEQQLGKLGSISVSYLNGRGEHQFLTRDLPSGSTIDAVNQSGGVFRQNQITTNVNIRSPKGITLFGFYSANWADSNISNITNPYNSRTDYGRAAFAVRSRVVLGGNIPLPYKITASPLLFAQSGSPYNVTTGVPDPTTLQFTDRPAFATGSSTANCYSAASFGGATGTTGEIPVNYCTGPASASVNLRLARTFGFGPKSDAAIAAAARAQAQGGPGGPGGPGGFGGGPGGPGGGGGGGGRPGGGGGPGGGGPGGGGPGGGGGGTSDRRYSITIGAQASNLFNEVPYGPEVSTLTSPLFGKSTTLQAGPGASANAVRRIMLQANFNF